MAIHDWNHDGKKDRMDDFIEYHIYENTGKNSINATNHNLSRNRSSQKRMSTIGAFLCIFSGLFWQALLFTILNVDIEGVPSFLIIVLWIVFSMITTGVVESINKK